MIGLLTRIRARKSAPVWRVIDETPEMTADFERLIAEVDESVSETWRCPYCREVNFADGRRQCSSCLLAAPPDPFDDPSYCCERCEHLTGLLQQAGGARALDAALADWFEQQMEAIHPMTAKRIRITVEISDPTPTEEYEDLPDNWDEMSQTERDQHLNQLGMTYLENQAGFGACVVDEDGNEVNES